MVTHPPLLESDEFPEDAKDRSVFVSGHCSPLHTTFIFPSTVCLGVSLDAFKLSSASLNIIWL